MKNIKILVFAASNSSKSINKVFANYLACQMERTDIISIDLNNFLMPIFSEDYEEKFGVPKSAYRFRKTMGQVDAIILSLAEHNGSYSAAFKNIIDWTSRININVFQSKPMLLLATSNGKNGASQVLNAALSFFPHLGANIIGHYSLPEFSKNFNLKLLHLDNEIMRSDIFNLVRNFQNEISSASQIFSSQDIFL